MKDAETFYVERCEKLEAALKALLGLDKKYLGMVWSERVKMATDALAPVSDQ